MEALLKQKKVYLAINEYSNKMNWKLGVSATSYVNPQQFNQEKGSLYIFICRNAF